MDPELEIQSDEKSAPKIIVNEAANESASNDGNVQPGQDTTQKQNVSGDSVSWLDDMDVSVADRPGADPFWTAVSAISDRLTIQRRIGKGGMSVVYKAFHQTMHKRVAVKLLLPHLTADPKSLKRFQLEAQATANLNHPNIVRIYDCGMTKSQSFIIMDYIEGESLEQIIDKEGKIAPERAVDLFIQFCEGMAHAHERGIIHRDLKPSNVMVTKYENELEQVKIVDFGIAKLLMDDDGSTMQKLTQTGEIFGSPLYMSPEQCSGKTLDSRSDIYSAGCLMYEALSGQPPIAGKNFFETMQRHVTDLPRPYINEGMGSSLAKRLQTIVFKCMAKEPSSRYQSMDDIIQDLRLITNSDGTRGGAWKQREKSLSDIVHKAGTKTRVIRNSVLALVSLGSLAVAAFIFNHIAEIKASSGWQDKALFQLVQVPKPKYSDSSFQQIKAKIGTDLDRMDGPVAEQEREHAFEDAGKMYFDYGKWKECRAIYNRLLKMPIGIVKTASCFTEIGKCELALGDLDQAKLAFHKAAELDLDAQNGYQRGEKSPSLIKLLGGLYGIKAKDAFAYLALIADMQNDLPLADGFAMALVRSTTTAETEGPSELAYDADLKRRMKNFGDASILFQRLKLSDSDGPEDDYRTKLLFALGLCHLANNEPDHAIADFDDAFKHKTGNANLLRGIDHEYHRALWLSGDYQRALTSPGHELQAQ